MSELRWITAQAVAANLVEVSAKGKRRRIFLPPKLREALRAYMKRSGIESGPVFATRAGRPLDRSNIWHDMKNLCRSAGVESTKVFPHNLRHLFAKEFTRWIRTSSAWRIFWGTAAWRPPASIL